MATTTPPAPPPSFHLEHAQLRCILAELSKRAGDLAEALQHIGIHADESIADLVTDATAQDLHQKASAIQSAATHALQVTGALLLVVGKLHALAWLRSTATQGCAPR